MKQQNNSKNREKASEGRIVQNRAGCVIQTATITLENPAPLQTVPA